MASKRKRKQADIEEAIEDTKKPGHNGFDPAKVQSFVGRIENLYSNIDTEKSEFMLACKAIHGDIKDVIQEAKDEAGIPKKELKKVIKARLLERKAEAVRDDLEDDEQHTYDLIRHALGDLADTPLGQAAATNSFRERNKEGISAGDAMTHGGPDPVDVPFRPPLDAA